MLTGFTRAADLRRAFEPAHYLLTGALLVATALARWALDPLLGHDLPFGPFVLPLVIAASLYGAGPALMCTLVGLFLGLLFGRHDPNTFALVSGAVLYAVTGVVVSLAVAVMERARLHTAQASRQVLEAHRHKDRFLAVLGHELRNPLNGIVLAAQYLNHQADEPAKTRAMAQLVDRQAKHMQRLLDEMLDISRIQQGKVQLVWTEVVLQEAIDFCLEQQARGLQSRGQTFGLHVPPARVTVPGDRDRIIQVIANLLTNASKYSGPRSHIELHLGLEAEAAVLAVQDNGPGIPPDKLPLIFEPFMQVETTLGRAEGGLGLGLPTVRKLVELHGGTVQARNRGTHPPAGAVFTVRLPLRRSVAPGPSAPASLPQMSAASQ